MAREPSLDPRTVMQVMKRPAISGQPKPARVFSLTAEC
jgi:hypothetical protein